MHTEESPATKRILTAPLEHVEDDIDDQDHARMDKQVLENADEEPVNLSRATFLLATIVSTSDGRLDPKYKETPAARALLKQHPELEEKLKEAWKERSFKEIRNLSTIVSCGDSDYVQAPHRYSTPTDRRQSHVSISPARLISHPDRSREMYVAYSEFFLSKGSHAVSVLTEVKGSLLSFHFLRFAGTSRAAAHRAWSDNWLGNSHILLANLMDELHKAPGDPQMKPYNHSISIIQSSGMGKSRLVDSVARIKFCFPFNMREPSPPGKFGRIGSTFGDVCNHNFLI